MRHKVLAVLLSAAVALSLAGCASMGVIGGEDGPTEIFITGPGAQRPGESGQIPSPDGGVPAPAEDPAVPAPDSDGYTGEEDGPLYETGLEEEAAPDEEGTYNSAEDVALYLACYGRLPDNYITKEEARELGWTGGSVEQVAPGCAIGGDRFGNREGILPAAEGRSYYECDIDTIGRSSRGAKRLVFSDDGLIYYTEDHYESFSLLYGEE